MTHHKHDWRPVEEPPVFEDAAAIFFEECDWVEITGATTSEKYDETFYSTGAECDATRSYRMEEVWVEKIRDDAPNVRYLRDSTPRYDRIAEEATMALSSSGFPIEGIDPDKTYGEVVAANDNWRIKYEP